MSLRDKGNEKFKAGQYKEAEHFYTQAIQQHSSDQRLFSNRALTRLRLQDWRNAEADARKAIELHGPDNPAAMKSYFYLAQALLELRHTTEALERGKKAYSICLETKDSSTETVSRFILRAKQAQWQSRETARLRDLNHTLATVEDLLQQQLERDMEDLNHRLSKGNLGETGWSEEKAQLEKEAAERRTVIRAAFADSKDKEMGEREIPDYLIDTISFEIMHDPVITPSGHSYERVGLLRHLQTSGVDPLTREPLTEKQLIPNVALRSACEEFLSKNGWAVDY